MADNTDQTPADAAAAPAKKPSKGRFIVIVGILVLLLGGGAAAFFAFRKPAEAATGDAAPKKETRAPTGIVSFEPFVVNLAGDRASRSDGLQQIVDAVKQNGYPNAKVTGKDSIDFGDGSGDIDVLTSDGMWWWGPQN